MQSPVPPTSRGLTAIRLGGRLARLTWPEPVENLAGVRFNEGLRIGLVRRNINGRRVEIVEIDRPNYILRNTSGQCHRDPVPLAVLSIPGALATQMSRVRQVAPWLIFKPVPLAEEVVAIVVANLGDVWVHHGDLVDVRSVDDHLTTVGDDRLELVEALGRGPDVFVLGRHDRQHPLYGMV